MEKINLDSIKPSNLSIVRDFMIVGNNVYLTIKLQVGVSKKNLLVMTKNTNDELWHVESVIKVPKCAKSDLQIIPINFKSKYNCPLVNLNEVANQKNIMFRTELSEFHRARLNKVLNAH